MAKTTEQFLEEKRANFVKFLQEILPRAASIDPDAIQALNNLATLPMSEFIKFIVFKLGPSANNLDAFLTQFAAENKLPLQVLTDAERQKTVKYLQCFIAALE